MSPELESARRALGSPLVALLPREVRQVLIDLVGLVARLEARISTLEEQSNGNSNAGSNRAR